MGEGSQTHKHRGKPQTSIFHCSLYSCYCLIYEWCNFTILVEQCDEIQTSIHLTIKGPDMCCSPVKLAHTGPSLQQLLHSCKHDLCSLTTDWYCVFNLSPVGLFIKPDQALWKSPSMRAPNTWLRRDRERNSVADSRLWFKDKSCVCVWVCVTGWRWTPCVPVITGSKPAHDLWETSFVSFHNFLSCSTE